jgi:hypothetical protein
LSSEGEEDEEETVDLEATQELRVEDDVLTQILNPDDDFADVVDVPFDDTPPQQEEAGSSEPNKINLQLDSPPHPEANEENEVDTEERLSSPVVEDTTIVKDKGKRRLIEVEDDTEGDEYVIIGNGMKIVLSPLKVEKRRRVEIDLRRL